WIARGEAPLELRRGLRDGRLGDCAGGGSQAGGTQKLTTFHASSPGLVSRGGCPRRLAAAARVRVALCPRAGTDHEAIVGVFRNLPPQILVVAERLHRIEDLLVIGICRRRLRIDLVRRL